MDPHGHDMETRKAAWRYLRDEIVEDVKDGIFWCWMHLVPRSLRRAVTAEADGLNAFWLTMTLLWVPRMLTWARAADGGPVPGIGANDPTIIIDYTIEGIIAVVRVFLR